MKKLPKSCSNCKFYKSMYEDYEMKNEKSSCLGRTAPPLHKPLRCKGLFYTYLPLGELIILTINCPTQITKNVLQ